MTDGINREQSLINELRPFLAGPGEIEGGLGAGDDCAILPEQMPGEQTVLTTDLLIEGTHFLNDERTDWVGVGAKAATANLSDIASMGARPVSLLVGLGLPRDFPVSFVIALYQGLSKVCRRFGAVIAGGDTTRADHVTIAITATGLKRDETAACRRSDAEPGDFVYVTGSLGGSRLGLETILNPADKKKLADLHYYKTPQIKVGLALAKLYPRVAMIDISDSLYNECGLIARASGVGIDLELDKVPVVGELSGGLLSSSQAGRYALFSGEEYELLFTVPVPPEKLMTDLAGFGLDCSITQIGTVSVDAGVRVFQDGKLVSPADETFRHFQ